MTAKTVPKEWIAAAFALVAATLALGVALLSMALDGPEQWVVWFTATFITLRLAAAAMYLRNSRRAHQWGVRLALLAFVCDLPYQASNLSAGGLSIPLLLFDLGMLTPALRPENRKLSGFAN